MMKIIKIKTWIKINKEIVEPLKLVRELLVCCSNDTDVKEYIKKIEVIANVIFEIQDSCKSILPNLIYNKVDFSSYSPRNKTLPIHPIDVSKAGSDEHAVAIKYFNYILESGDVVIEVYTILS